jgi:hypothetical protein
VADNEDTKPYIATGDHESRVLGESRPGIVGLRNFDAGVITTMRPELIDHNYFLTGVSPVAAPPGSPGIPIVFTHPEDLYERYKLPGIFVRRDDLSPALSRLHPGHRRYRTPARTAKKIQATVGGNPGTTGAETVESWDRWEMGEQAMPFDITYTISIMARARGYGAGQPTPDGASSPRNQLNQILDRLLRVYQPWCRVVVEDSIGDLRSYHAAMEAISHLDQVAEVTDRVLGFALTLRVEAELDLNDPVEAAAVAGTIGIGSEDTGFEPL